MFSPDGTQKNRGLISRPQSRRCSLPTTALRSGTDDRPFLTAPKAVWLSMNQTAARLGLPDKRAVPTHAATASKMWI